MPVWFPLIRLTPKTKRVYFSNCWITTDLGLPLVFTPKSCFRISCRRPTEQLFRGNALIFSSRFKTDVVSCWNLTITTPEPLPLHNTFLTNKGIGRCSNTAEYVR